jgi:hypothetical protein
MHVFYSRVIEDLTRIFWHFFVPEVYPVDIWVDVLGILHYFGFERTRWRLFQKRFVCTKFDIYIFIKQQNRGKIVDHKQ